MPSFESLEQLSAAVGALPVAGIVTDSDGAVVAANAIAETMFGYDAGGLVGLTVETLVPERLRAEHIRQRAEFLIHPIARQVGDRLNIRGQRRDGSEFPLDVGLQQVATPGGDFTLCCLSDLTARVQATEEKQSSERRYRDLFQSSRDMVYVHDADGKFLELNPAALRMLGYAPPDVADLRMEDVLDGRHFEAVRQGISEIVAGGVSPGPQKLLVHKKDGTDLWIEVNAHVAMKDGRAIGVLGIARDVMERTRREDALSSTSAFRELVMESATDAIVAFDEQQRFTLVNRRVEEITGYTAGELIGQSTEVLQPSPTPPDGGLLTKLLEGGAPVKDAEREIRCKDGSTRTMRISLGPIVRDGAIVGAAGTVQDVTESRRSAELLASQRQLLELVASGTPLPDALEAVCGDVREHTRGGGCWLRVGDGTGSGIRGPVAVGLPDAVQRALAASITADHENGISSVVCVDVDLAQKAPADPRWGGLRSAMAAHGLRQAWVVPIRSGADQHLGDMAICVREAEMPARELLDVAAHVVGVAIERARTERALRETEQRYRQIFAVNTAIKLIIDPSTGAIMEANPAACEFYGYPLEEFTRKAIFDLATVPRNAPSRRCSARLRVRSCTTSAIARRQARCATSKSTPDRSARAAERCCVRLSTTSPSASAPTKCSPSTAKCWR
jgi:PAS domain S-box-containing protein